MRSSTTNTTTIGTIGAPSRRNTELAMLEFAVLNPVFAYVNDGSLEELDAFVRDVVQRLTA